MNKFLTFNFIALLIGAGNVFPSFEAWGKKMDEFTSNLHTKFDQLMVKNSESNITHIEETDDTVVISVHFKQEKIDIKKLYETLKIVKKTTGQEQQIEVNLAYPHGELNIQITPNSVNFTSKQEIIEICEDNGEKSNVSSFSSSSGMQSISPIDLDAQASFNEAEKEFIITLPKKTPTITTQIPVTIK